MHTRILGLTASAFIVADGAVGAIAQDRMKPQQPDQEQIQSRPMDQDEERTMGQGTAMHDGAAGTGAMRGEMSQGGMTGRAMMPARTWADGPPIMFRIMFALADSDGDGTISLQEFQAAHERVFKAMDANKDGQLSDDEILAFLHGVSRSTPEQ